MLEILETKIEALGHPVKTIIAKVFLNRLNQGRSRLTEYM